MDGFGLGHELAVLGLAEIPRSMMPEFAGVGVDPHLVLSGGRMGAMFRDQRGADVSPVGFRPVSRNLLLRGCEVQLACADKPVEAVL
jgi:hypothetical protein